MFCKYCGKEIFDEAVICPGCGCSTGREQNAGQNVNGFTPVNDNRLVNELSQKVMINGIIWIAISVIQIILGLFVNYFFLIVGVLNIVSSVMDLSYSKEVVKKPVGVVKKFEPLAGPVIVLVYNLVFGGVIGVVGSIYYLVAIRNFVLTNRAYFEQLDRELTPNIR